jgi:hypothetical protein
MSDIKSDGLYAVLGPWAEVDPVPLKGLAPRLDSLAGKKIGLFCNFKEAAGQIFTVLEKHLKEKFRDIDFKWYYNMRMGTAEIESERREEFEKWLSDLDAVLLAVGD